MISEARAKLAALIEEEEAAGRAALSREEEERLVAQRSTREEQAYWAQRGKEYPALPAKPSKEKWGARRKPSYEWQPLDSDPVSVC